MRAAQAELAETAGPHPTPPGVHSEFVQGRPSTALASLRSGRDDIINSMNFRVQRRRDAQTAGDILSGSLF